MFKLWNVLAKFFLFGIVLIVIPLMAGQTLIRWSTHTISHDAFHLWIAQELLNFFSLCKAREKRRNYVDSRL